MPILARHDVERGIWQLYGSSGPLCDAFWRVMTLKRGIWQLREYCNTAVGIGFFPKIMSWEVSDVLWGSEAGEVRLATRVTDHV